ncbi:MAG: DNA repair protein RecO [Lachnospiraceae bacterium]|nr:DNA repair protein RecO [Lachnospiraceae bacterium]
MGQTVTLIGLVLAAYPFGDYDKRLVMLTRERGKVTVFAKGARRPNSSLLAVVKPFVFGEFILYEGRSAFNLMQARISRYFEELSQDMEAACYGCYFCEIAEYYTREANDEVQMLKLLYQSLRALSTKSIPRPLVRYIYELKALVINGVCPVDFEKLEISPSALYTLQYIATSSMERLYTFTVSREVLGEIQAVMNRYRQLYMEGQYKSLEVLKVLSQSSGAELWQEEQENALAGKNVLKKKEKDGILNG